MAVRKDYAATTGLENFVGGSATKISLLTELWLFSLVGEKVGLKGMEVANKFGREILPPPSA